MRHDRPRCLIVLPLEGVGQIVLDCGSHEDELRLRNWLRRSEILRRLPEVVLWVLDELDDLGDEGEAA